MTLRARKVSGFSRNGALGCNGRPEDVYLKMSKVSAPDAFSVLISAATLKIQNFSFATLVKKGCISCDVFAIYGTSRT